MWFYILDPISDIQRDPNWQLNAFYQSLVDYTPVTRSGLFIFSNGPGLRDRRVNFLSKNQDSTAHEKAIRQCQDQDVLDFWKLKTSYGPGSRHGRVTFLSKLPDFTAQEKATRRWKDPDVSEF